jgi:hypothetical protein
MISKKNKYSTILLRESSSKVMFVVVHMMLKDG